MLSFLFPLRKSSRSKHPQPLCDSTLIWGFGGLTRKWGMNDRPSAFFWIFWGMLFANFDCTIRIYLNWNVNNMCFFAIVYSYYKNTSIRLCEENKKSPDPKNSPVSWPRTLFWIFLDRSLCEVLFYLYIIQILHSCESVILRSLFA